jgi:hypothetical protein
MLLINNQTHSNQPTMALLRAIRNQAAETPLLTIADKPVQLHQADWYWLFRSHITAAVEEEMFRQLYRPCDRTAVPVREMVAMYLLQEAFGWSDSQLISECSANYKVRYALGMNNTTQPLPGIFVYNDFRQKLHAHTAVAGEDLMEAFIDSLLHEGSPVRKVTNHTVVLWSLNVA